MYDRSAANTRRVYKFSLAARRFANNHKKIVSLCKNRRIISTSGSLLKRAGYISSGSLRRKEKLVEDEKIVVVMVNGETEGRGGANVESGE